MDECEKFLPAPKINDHLKPFCINPSELLPHLDLPEVQGILILRCIEHNSDMPIFGLSFGEFIT